jgi:hypothetical protein
LLETPRPPLHPIPAPIRETLSTKKEHQLNNHRQNSAPDPSAREMQEQVVEDTVADPQHSRPVQETALDLGNLQS